jgi:hypothetical protein
MSRRAHPPCACGACRSCLLRQAWAAGAFVTRRNGRRWDTWSREEDRRLAELAGRDLEEIAAILTAEFCVPRTAVAVRVHATRRDISLWRNGFSLRDLERLFGVDHRAIVRRWIGPGLLPARRRRGRGAHDGWLIEADDLDAFVRTHPWAYDWRRMDRRHPLAVLGRAVCRASGWLGRGEAARALRVHPETISRWVARGLLAHRRRAGAGGKGELVVPVADLLALREVFQAARGRSRERLADGRPSPRAVRPRPGRRGRAA